MGDSDDMDMEVAPPRHKDPISEETLVRMFESQEQRLKTVLQVELGKRFPTTTVSNDRTQMQIPRLFDHIMGRVPGNQNTQAVIDELLQQNHQLQQVNDSLTSQVNATRRDLSDERTKNQELTQRMASLRQMLVPPSQDQVSDSEIQSRFTNLRSLILRLVKGTWARNFKQGINQEALTDYQRDFFAQFAENSGRWKTLHNALRCVVFDFLHCYVLSRRHFALHKKAKRLDNQLEEAETSMWNKLSEASRGLLMDWRIATMKATEDFRDDQRSLSHCTQRYIWEFVSILDTNGPEAEGKGKQLLEKICNDAADLSLMMRKAKDHIYIDRMSEAKGRPISEYDTIVDEEASEAASSKHKPQTIAYIITGALMKHPKENPTETKILEKAQAVVYE